MLTVIGALVLIGLVLAMREVPRESPAGRALPFGQQLAVCGRFLRRPVLGWLFGFFVAIYVIEHVPYMFIQPYLATLLGTRRPRPWRPACTRRSPR